ncbi:MAG TPA: DMT family transporter [Flavisolibacter sp.]|nr:DMT family transporter [Flavisolibacter sp.]
MAKQNFFNWLLFVVLSIVWGSSFILMKTSAEHLNELQIGAIRIFAAGIAFLPWAVFHVSKIPVKKLRVVILTGLLGNFLPALLFASAIKGNGESSLASILNSLTPLFVIVIGVFFFKAKIQSRKIAGVLVGFAGLVILSLLRGPVDPNDNGLLLILIATIFYGITVNLVSHYLKGIDGFKIASVSLVVMAIPAGILMLQQNVFSIARYDDHARLSIAVACLLGIVGSAIATALYYILIQKAGGVFASLVTYAIPVVAMMWGLLANENITAIQAGCLAIILVGVYLANR